MFCEFYLNKNKTKAVLLNSLSKTFKSFLTKSNDSCMCRFQRIQYKSHISISSCPNLVWLLYFLFFFFFFFFFFLSFIVIQLQLSAFSPHPSTPPQPIPPPSPTSSLPLDFVHVSFIAVPENPPPHYISFSLAGMIIISHHCTFL